VLRQVLRRPTVFSGCRAVFTPLLRRNPVKTPRFHGVVTRLHPCKSFANFLNRLSLKRIEDDYAGLF
jgi:hypothetical protein